MRKLFLFYLFHLLSGSVQAGVQNSTSTCIQEQKKALLVGNKNYTESASTQWGDLKNPINDATAFANLLISFSFENPIILIDKQKTALINSIQEFVDCAIASGSKEIVFYFSGHGASIGDTNYLIPIGEGNSISTLNGWIPLSEITAIFEKNKKAIKILFFDACRSDPPRLPLVSRYTMSGESNSQYKGSTPITSGFASIPAPPNDTIIVFSTNQGSPASDFILDGDSNSAYMQGLIQALSQPSPIRLNSILSIAGKKAQELTEYKQQPHSYGPDATKESYLFYRKNDLSPPDWRSDFSHPDAIEYPKPKILK